MPGTDWWLYRGDNNPKRIDPWPAPPPWRRFDGLVQGAMQPPALGPREEQIGSTYLADEKICNLVNAAIYLRRPLLVTGNPGTGKSSLAYAVAYELKLGQVLHWPVTSRSTLAEALYRYDAIGRLHAAQLGKEKAEWEARSKTSPAPDTASHAKAEAEELGQYIRLGPLGTALLPVKRPRVLLIDEIDKSDIDLPNDLLHVFETGEYEIPELARMREELGQVPVLPHGEDTPVTIVRGQVKCSEFPFVVLTSNGERELPPAFLRRCIRLNIDDPIEKELAQIVTQKFASALPVDAKTWSDQQSQRETLIHNFFARRAEGREQLSTDQLLNAVYLVTQGVNLNDPLEPGAQEKILDAVLRALNRS